MKFTFKRLENPPDDIAYLCAVMDWHTRYVSESEERICSSQYEELIGQKASVNRLKPWKGRVVALSSPSGTIYRLIKGHGNLSIPSGVFWIGPKTRSQLDIHDNSEVEITPVSNQWWARCLYYNSHLDDAVRFSFRIGFWGLSLAVISLGLSLISILKP